MDLSLEPIDVKHKDFMDNIRCINGVSTNTGSFQSGYLWRDVLGVSIHTGAGYYAIHESVNPENVWAFPIGDAFAKKQFIERILSKYSRAVLLKVKTEDKEFLEKEFPGVFSFSYCQDTCEYVYDSRDIMGLHGKKFRKFREALNKFSAHHSLEVQEITEDTLPVVRAVFQKWACARERTGMDNTIGNETDGIVLTSFSKIGLSGIILKVDGEAASVAIGYPLSEDTCDIAIFKHTGVVENLCRITVHEFINRYQESFRYFNFEEDGGIVGLRTIKKRMCPCRLNPIWKAVAGNTNREKGGLA